MVREEDGGCRDKRALLVSSFGTSHRGTREKTLDVMERSLQKKFAGYEFCRAYTSPTIVRILKERDGIAVDSVKEALERLLGDGYRRVLAQTTHVIPGFEYDRMKGVLESYRRDFDSLVWGEPLLSGDRDYREVVQVLGRELEGYRGPGTVLVLMGHGTEHAANLSYGRLQEEFLRQGFEDYLVGTAEASPTLEAMEGLVRQRKPGRVVLAPFLMVAGEHACRDMAGDGEDSWKSRFLRRGCQVECVMKGLGEYDGIRQIYIRHAKEAEVGI